MLLFCVSCSTDSQIFGGNVNRSLGKNQLERALGLHPDQQRGITSDKFSGSLAWDLQQVMRQEQEEWEEWKPIVPKWRKGKRRGVRRGA